MQVDRRPQVLVLSRNYPNDVQKLLGMWVRQIVAASAEICDPKVIAPEGVVDSHGWMLFRRC